MVLLLQEGASAKRLRSGSGASDPGSEKEKAGELFERHGAAQSGEAGPHGAVDFAQGEAVQLDTGSRRGPTISTSWSPIFAFRRHSFFAFEPELKALGFSS